MTRGIQHFSVFNLMSCPLINWSVVLDPFLDFASVLFALAGIVHGKREGQ